jgi:hypothetical protein
MFAVVLAGAAQVHRLRRLGRGPVRAAAPEVRLLRTGAVCTNFIGPFDGPHGEVVTIVAEANDAPTIEHRVTVR